MATLTRLINPRCPCCGRKSLESRQHRILPDVDEQPGLPAWLWTACVACGSHFKEQHFGDGTLHEVAPAEWQLNVLTR